MSWADDTILRANHIYGISQQVCGGTALTVVKAREAQTDDIERAWKVKRLYYVQDFKGVFQHVEAVYRDAWGRANMAIQQGITVGLDIAGIDEQMQVFNATVTEGTKFATGYRDAMAQGKQAIDAPDFKEWALRMLKTSTTLLWWAEYTACRSKYTVGNLLSEGWAALKAGLAKFLAIIVAIVEAVIAVAEAIYNIPGNFMQMLGVIKWIAILGGAGFLIYKGHGIYADRQRRLRGGGA